MIKKLVQDFLEADEIDKLIIKEQLAKDPGVRILRNMIQNVIDDIKTVDKKAFEALDITIVELDKINIEKKKQIKVNAEKPEDSIGERQLSSALLMEDYNKYHKLLNYNMIRNDILLMQFQMFHKNML